MKSKRCFVFFLLALLVLSMLSVASASLSSNMGEVKKYVNQYDANEITAAQLVVYLDYVQSKMYEELDLEDRKAFTESEIKVVFEEVDKGGDKKHDFHGPDYEKRFETDDFEIVFATHRFFEYDEDYWEKRESEADVLYGIYYELKAFNVEVYDSIPEQVDSFVDDFMDMVEADSDDKSEQEELRKQWNQIKQRFWEMQDQDRCAEIMEEIGMQEEEENYGTDLKYYKILEQINHTDCWNEPGECHKECDTYEVCDDCKPDCEMVDECYDKCEEVCEEVFNEETNETEEICEEQCEEVCEEHEVCTGCEDVECYTEENCWEECDGEGEEVCNSWSEQEIRLEGNCREDGSDLWIGSWGEDFDKYQGINEGGDWNCNSEVEALVKVREVLQEDLDNNFAEWYFEEFLAGDDYDKIINGGGGFHSVLEMLIRNEEEIADRLHCYEFREWPDGFDKIDIEYSSGNAHVEVWEKLAPVEWDEIKYYTTLFKYSWVPDKELMKGLINYKIEQTDDFGPSAKDIAEIKQDEGQMEVITSLAEKYGGSFDVKLELEQEDSDFAVLKYLQINPDVAIQMVDEIDDRPDISIKVDYDVLHNFISYMVYEMEGDKIRGPHWVWIEGDEGPGKFFSALGAISKMWKEGVTIKPRFALVKMLFSTGDLIELMKGPDSDAYQEELFDKGSETNEGKSITAGVIMN